MTEQRKINVGFGLFGLLGATIALAYFLSSFNHNYLTKLEKDKKLGKGFVIPSKLEIKTEDLDHDGTFETTISYENKKGLYKIDPQTGFPTVIPYELKPATNPQIILKQNYQGKSEKE